MGMADGLEVAGACTTGATEQAASMPTIAAIKKPTRNGRRVKKRGFCMGLILLEALLALCIFIVIVWWTMFSGRSKGELRQAPAAPDQAPNEASPNPPGAALSEAAPTPAPTSVLTDAPTNQATPDDSRR
jgi:cbb3-type cytochrome oxidase subunit 3